MTSKRDMFKALVGRRLDELARMLHSGADVDIVADFDTSLLAPSQIAEGDSLVHVALHMENQDALELLLRFGANLNVSAADGVTPLQIAVNKGLDDIALWLLDNRANFNAADRFGLTPLHYTDSPEILERILAKGVSVDLKAHSTGYTPLHYAAYHNQGKKVRLLLSHGAHHSERGDGGETPLHLLMARKYNEVDDCANILLGAGSEIDAKDLRGNTPLHWALGIHASENWMDRGNPKAIEFLLDHKANVRLKNRDGLTPLALAWRCPDKEYREVFRKRSFRPTLADRVSALG